MKEVMICESKVKKSHNNAYSLMNSILLFTSIELCDC